MKNIRPISHTVSQSTNTSVKSVLTNTSTNVTSAKVTGVSIIEQSKPKFYTPTIIKPLNTTVTANFGNTSLFSSTNIQLLEQNTTKLSASFISLSPTPFSKLPLFDHKMESLADKYLLQYSENTISVADLPDSELRPKGVSKEAFFQGPVVGSFIRAINAGVSPQEAFLCSVYAFGSPGTNFNIIQRVIKDTMGTNANNMLSYMLESYLNSFSLDTLKELGEMDFRRGSLFMEMFSMAKINKDLQHPLTRYQCSDVVTSDPAIQNLTHNASPDFVRHFSPPIGGIRNQYYDQKSGIGWMSKQNHVRPVTSELGDTVNEANKTLVKSLNSWMYKTNNRTHIIGNSLLEDLAALEKAHEQNQNAEHYASSYNKIRDTHNVFLTENNIPMNLVTEVGLKQMLLNKDSVKFFQETYLHMCYSPSSSWVRFLNSHLQKTNGVMNNYPEVIKEFATMEFDSL